MAKRPSAAVRGRGFASAAVQVPFHGLAQQAGFAGVGRARVRRLAHRLGGEFGALPVPHLMEVFVFQEAGRAQRLDEVADDLAHFQVVGQPHQRGAQIELRIAAIEKGQALHQHRRNDQHGVA